MSRYSVEMRIDFSGEVEADSQDEAEQLAWVSWGAGVGDLVSYDGVYSIDVDKIEEEDEDEEDE